MGGRNCSICGHANRGEIEAAFLQGTPNRIIADQFETSASAVFRHAKRCMAASVKAAREAQGAAKEEAGRSTLERLEDALRQTLGIVEKAQAGGDLRLALSGLDSVRRHLELSAKLLGELREGGVNVAVGVKVDAGQASASQIAEVVRMLASEEIR